MMTTHLWLCSHCCSSVLTHIVNKLAFMPQHSTYAVKQNANNTKLKLVITDTSKIWDYGERPPLKHYDLYYVTTLTGNRIVCLYIRLPTNANAHSQYTILYSHGNAEDIGQRTQFYQHLGVRMNCNVLVYDYSGYGGSTGSASETNIYADIDAAFRSLKSRYNINDDRIILFGASIGCVPTIDLATRYQVRGVVIESAFMSGLRIMCPRIKKSYSFDPFPNIDKISKVLPPVLIIHGTKDKTINKSHGKQLFRRCKTARTPLWVEDGGHNDLQIFPEYWNRLSHFVKIELKH